MPLAHLSFPPVIKRVEATYVDDTMNEMKVRVKMEGWYFNTRIQWWVDGPQMKPADWDGTYWDTDFEDDWIAALAPYGYDGPI